MLNQAQKGSGRVYVEFATTKEAVEARTLNSKCFINDPNNSLQILFVPRAEMILDLKSKINIYIPPQNYPWKLLPLLSTAVIDPMSQLPLDQIVFVENVPVEATINDIINAFSHSNVLPKDVQRFDQPGAPFTALKIRFRDSVAVDEFLHINHGAEILNTPVFFKKLVP